MRKLGILVAVMLLAMVYAVSATLTFVTPASGAVLTDSATTKLINVSSTYPHDQTAYVNITLYCTDTVNNTEIKITSNMSKNVTPSGAAWSYWQNSTIDINKFIDSSNCILTARDNNSASTTVTVTLDTTVPTCSHSQSSNTAYKPSQTWTVTGRNGTSATLQFGSNAYLTMTESSDVFTYTGDITEYTYPTVVARVSDGLNTTSCTLEYVKIDADAALGKVAIYAADEPGLKLSTPAQPGISPTIIWIGLAAVALFIYKKKN